MITRTSPKGANVDGREQLKLWAESASQRNSERIVNEYQDGMLSMARGINE
jgi:hypothetical protein